MKRIHCDICDGVIPDDRDRLTVLLGRARGNRSEDEERSRDVCPACVEQNKILRDWLAEQAPLLNDKDRR